MLTQKNRLRIPYDFKKVFAYGKTLREGFLTIKALNQHSGPGRFAFVVPSSLSKKAVVRNKVRRRLRAIVRSVVPVPYPPFNVIVFAYKGVEDLEYKDLKDTLCALLKKAHIVAGL